MNSAAPSIESVWSPRRCYWIAMFIFVAQVGFIWLAQERPKIVRSDTIVDTSFQLIAEPLAADDIFNTIAAPLPDVFALPNKAGFSGPVWLKLKKTSYEPPQWSEPPRWLAHTKYPSQSLAGSITPSEHPLEPAQKISARDDVPVFLPQTGQTSSMRVEGPLAQRYIGTVKLRSWQNFEPLVDSVVEIGVNSAGSVVSSRLVSRSGYALADESALEIARTSRFRPLNTTSANPVFGRMVFRWETLPVAPTATAEQKP